MRHGAVLVLLSLLVWPCAAANLTEGSITHSDLQVNGSGTYRSASLGAFDVDDGATPPSIRWTARQARLVIEQSLEVVDQPAASFQQGLDPEIHEYVNVQGSIVARPGYLVALLGGQALHSTPCLHVASNALHEEVPHRVVTNRTPLVIPPGLLADSCTPEWVLEGTAQLQLWETTLRLHDGQEHVVETGRTQGVGAPTRREAYLTLTDAQLTYSPGSGQVALGGLEGQASGAFTFSNYATDLPGMDVKSGEILSLTGDLDLHAQFDSHAIVSTVKGRVAAGLADQTSFTVQGTAAQRQFSAWSIAALALGLSLASVHVQRTGILARKPTIHAERLDYVRQLLRLERPRHALTLLQRQRFWNPRDPETRSLLGDAHAQLRHPRRALHHYQAAYERLQDRDEPLASHAAYESSCAAATLGRVGPALHWLAIAIRHDPNYAWKAREEPALAILARSLQFQDLVNGLVGWRPRS